MLSRPQGGMRTAAAAGGAVLQQSPAVPTAAPVAANAAETAHGPHQAAAAHTGPATAAQSAPWMPSGYDLCLPSDVDALLALPARFLAQLPVSGALLLELHDRAQLSLGCEAGPRAGWQGHHVVITTARAVYAAAAAAGVPAFHGGELAVMVLAAERGRLAPAAVVQWCEHKNDPARAGWELGRETAFRLGPAVGPAERPELAVFGSPRGWAFGPLLAAMGVRLVAVYAAGGRD